jgi:hypothetical protein
MYIHVLLSLALHIRLDPYISILFLSIEHTIFHQLSQKTNAITTNHTTQN